MVDGSTANRDVRASVLEEKRRREVTPVGLIEQTVREVTGRGCTEMTRLVGGEVNEVYAVTTDRQEGLVVRIARNPIPWFVDEAAVMSAAAAVGVPTPEVLGVRHVEHDQQLLSFSVQRLVEGVPLDSLIERLDAEDAVRLVEEAGELLGRLHSVRADRGVVHVLEAPGEGRLDQLRSIAFQTGGDRAARMIDLAVSRLHLHSEPAPPVTVAHADWTTKHFLVADRRIVAVLDWERSGPGSPCVDLALWDVHLAHRPHHGMETFLRGYRRARDPDRDLTTTFDAYRIDWVLEMLSYYDGLHRPLTIHCLDTLQRILADPFEQR